MIKFIIIVLLISSTLISKDYKNGKKLISEKEPIIIEYETSRDFYFYNYETCSCHKKIKPKKKVTK